jgi:hypothetical protein
MCSRLRTRSRWERYDEPGQLAVTRGVEDDDGRRGSGRVLAVGLAPARPPLAGLSLGASRGSRQGAHSRLPTSPIAGSTLARLCAAWCSSASPRCWLESPANNPFLAIATTCRRRWRGRFPRDAHAAPVASDRSAQRTASRDVRNECASAKVASGSPNPPPVRHAGSRVASSPLWRRSRDAKIKSLSVHDTDPVRSVITTRLQPWPILRDDSGRMPDLPSQPRRSWP